MITNTFIHSFTKGDLYHAQKEIPLSQLTSQLNQDIGKNEHFSYVTGPLDYGRTYTIKLAAINTYGLKGNQNISKKLEKITIHII